VALVHPVVVVSRVVAVLAVSRVATVSPVLVMRWFSFVHQGFKSSNRTNRVSADSEHLSSGCRGATVRICGEAEPLPRHPERSSVEL
jgi:hypothetical protein